MNIREFHAEVERMKGVDGLPKWAKIPTGRHLLALLLRYDVPTTHVCVNNYDGYLASPEWRKRRAVVLILANVTCGCGRQAWQVHHLTYERKGEELLRDLLPVCGNCHQVQHDLARMRLTKMDREAHDDLNAPRLWWECGY